MSHERQQAPGDRERQEKKKKRRKSERGEIERERAEESEGRRFGVIAPKMGPTFFSLKFVAVVEVLAAKRSKAATLSG